MLKQGYIIKEFKSVCKRDNLHSVLEKKLSLAKLQQVIIQKSSEGREDIGGSLSDDDKEMLKDLVNGLGNDTPSDDNFNM